MESSKIVRQLDMATNAWNQLSEEAQFAMKAIISRLNHPSTGVIVTHLATAWFIIEHSSRDYDVQLFVSPTGNTLDMSIYSPGEDNYGVSNLTAVALDSENISFAVQRALATLGQHRRTVVDGDSTSEQSIRHNSNVDEDFQREYLCKRIFD